MHKKLLDKTGIEKISAHVNMFVVFWQQKVTAAVMTTKRGEKRKTTTVCIQVNK